MAPRSSSPMGDQDTRPAKQRRLNDNERQRAVQACDGCRRVKEKCEGGVPCRKCRHFGRPCLFSKVAAKEARPRAGTNASTNAVRTEISKPAANDERQRALEMIAQHFLPNVSLELASLRPIVKDITTKQPGSAEHGSSSTSPDDENSGVEEDCTVNAVQDNIAHYSGEFSYWNFSQRVKQHVKVLESEEPAGPSADTENLSDYWRVEQLTSNPNTVTDVVKSMPPQPVGEFLVKVFFSHACDNYFFVERKWLDQKIYDAYNTPQKLNNGDVGTLAVILLIFAVGSQYAHLEAAQGKDDPATSDWDQQLGSMFYQKAVRLLPEILHLGSLESVQATLLLALYMLPIDAAGMAWMYANMSMKLAIQNGMHRNPPKSFTGTSKAEVRNRVWWTAYCIEKKISVFHGRPTSIAATDIDVDLPVTLKELESAEQPLSIDLFRMSIGLIQRLETIRGQIAGLASAATDGKENAKGLAALLMSSKALLGWWKENDPELRDRSFVVSRTMLHLRLEFCLIRMFIGRPFMLASVRPSSTVATPDSIQDIDAGSAASAPASSASKSQRSINKAALVQDCVEAAKDAIEICQSIQQSVEGLARASYLEYSSCRAALLVLLAHCINTKTHSHEQAINSGLELISEMETTGESAKSEIKLIRALERAMRRLIQSHRSRVASTSVSADKKGYEDFRKWQTFVQQLGTSSPAAVAGAPPVPNANAHDQYSTAQSENTAVFSEVSPFEFPQGMWASGTAGSFFDLDDFNFALDDQILMNSGYQ